MSVEIASLALEIDSTSAVTMRERQDAATASGERLENQTTRLSAADKYYQSIARRTHETVDQVRSRYEAAAVQSNKLTAAVADQAKVEELALNAMNKHGMSAREATVAIAYLEAASASFNKEANSTIEQLKKMGGVSETTGNQLGILGTLSQRARTDIMQMTSSILRGDFPAASRQILQLVSHSWEAVKSLAAMVAPAVAAAAALGFFIKKQIEIEKFNQELGKVEGILAGTGRAGLVAQADLTKYAEELKRSGRMTEEFAFKSLSALASQGRMSAGVFHELVGLIPDFARGMGIDGPAAANQLGEALGNPIKGVLSLDEKLNILTVDQYKQVEAMAKVGDAAGIQEIALQALHKRFDGLRNEGLTPMQLAWEEVLKLWRGTPTEGEKTSSFINTLAGYVVLLTDAAKQAKTWWAEFMKWIGDTAPIKAVNAALEVSLYLRRALGITATEAQSKEEKAYQEWLKHRKEMDAQDARAIAGQEAALLARQKKEKERLEEQKKMEAEALKEKERLRKLDDAGWVKHIDDQIAAEFKALQEEAKRWDEYYKEQARLQKLDDAGWVKHIDAMKKAEEDALTAMAKMHKSYMQEKEIADKKYAESMLKMWTDVSEITAAFFVDIVVNGQNAFDSLKRILKQFLAELIAIFAKRWILQLGASMAGGVGQTALAEMLGGQSNLAGAGSLAGSLAGFLSGGASSMSSWLLGTAGTAAAPGVLAGAPPTVGLLGAEGMLMGIGATGWGLIITAAIAVVSYLASRRGGPKEEGASGPDALFGTISGGQLNQQLADFKKATLTTFTDILRGFGITQNGMNFEFKLSTDPAGTAQTVLDAVLRDRGGNVLFHSAREIGRDPNTYSGEMQLEAQRVILMALQSSDLPSAVAQILNSITAAGATMEEINRVIGAALEMQQILKGLGDLKITGLTLTLDELKGFQNTFDGETIAQTFQRIAGGWVEVVAAFTSDETKLAKAQFDLQGLFESLGEFGYAVPKTREGWLDVMRSLDKTTESGRELFTRMLALAPSFDAVSDAAASMMDDFDSLMSRMRPGYAENLLGMQQQSAMDAFRAANAWVGTQSDDSLLAALRTITRQDFKNYSLANQQLIMTILGVDEQLNPLTDTINRATGSIDRLGEAAEGSSNAMLQAQDNIAKWLRDSRMRPESPYDPKQRLGFAEEEFNRLLKLAQGGDASAMQQITGAAETWKQMAWQVFGSGSQFQGVFDKIWTSLTGLLGPGWEGPQEDPLRRALPTGNGRLASQQDVGEMTNAQRTTNELLRRLLVGADDPLPPPNPLRTETEAERR